jgi:predicted transcriptional regulator
MSDTSANADILGLTAEIVSAHVSNNSVAVADLPNLIQEVYRTLSGMGQPVTEVAERPQPAVPVKKSVTPEYLICLEDGKKLKMLKRHLKTSFNLTPDQYRERWGAAVRLSHGGAELYQASFDAGQAHRPRHQATRPPGGAASRGGAGSLSAAAREA